MRTIALATLLAILLLAASCGGSKPEKPNTPLAQNVIYLHSGEGSLGGKKILERHVKIAAPPEEYAKLDKAAIAQTAMKAAWSAYEETGADIVVIWIEADKALIGKGSPLGKAVYTPGGVNAEDKECPVWSVQAVSRYPTSEEISARTYPLLMEAYDVK